MLSEVVLLISILSLSALSADRINFPSGRTYPIAVTLERELTTPAKTQQFGECHIFAAVAAAEAACFRHTRRHFSLSPAYFFYRHLIGELANPSNQPFLADQNDGQFSQNDAGYYETTLEQIQKNSAMLDSEYSMSQFNHGTRQALNTRAHYWKLVRAKKTPNRLDYENKMRSELAAGLNQSIKSVGPLMLSKSDQGYTQIVTKVIGHPLQACEFSQLQTTTFTVTPERAVALINSGIPFICQSTLGGTNGQHVVLYSGYSQAIGYRENLSFKVRDSRLSRLLDTGWAPYCLRATAVYYPYERSSVLKSINL